MLLFFFFLDNSFFFFIFMMEILLRDVILALGFFNESLLFQLNIGISCFYCA